MTTRPSPRMVAPEMPATVDSCGPTAFTTTSLPIDSTAQAPAFGLLQPMDFLRALLSSLPDLSGRTASPMPAFDLDAIELTRDELPLELADRIGIDAVQKVYEACPYLR